MLFCFSFNYNSGCGFHLTKMADVFITSMLSEIIPTTTLDNKSFSAVQQKMSLSTNQLSKKKSKTFLMINY